MDDQQRRAIMQLVAAVREAEARLHASSAMSGAEMSRYASSGAAAWRPDVSLWLEAHRRENYDEAVGRLMGWLRRNVPGGGVIELPGYTIVWRAEMPGGVAGYRICDSRGLAIFCYGR